METKPDVNLTPTPARLLAGAALRREAKRRAHGEWQAMRDRPDPVTLLAAQDKHRIAALVPLRHARMRVSPFTFYRGAAAVMNADLATTQTAGLHVQACGDCHLMNFGAFASPEGAPVFDINDFDETLPAPFEWDLKRLATSFVIAGQNIKLGQDDCRDLARRAAQAYRETVAELAPLPPFDAWHTRIDLQAAVAAIPKPRARKRAGRNLHDWLTAGAEHYGLVTQIDGKWRLKDKPPAMFHLTEHEAWVRQAFAAYAKTLTEDRRLLLGRYQLADIAFKAVGVGSVGTFCAVALYVSADGAPLLLQIKEAQESVLAPFAGASAYANQGERVVAGQRIMQAASDLFLGWTATRQDGRQFYVRRLKDSRLADLGAELQEDTLDYYAQLCGRTLGRAHVRSGDAAAMAGYMGASGRFDAAIAAFAMEYAKQNAADWRRFQAAIASGRLAAAASP
jgi:uncharacterized protein (DUF2252 family)